MFLVCGLPGAGKTTRAKELERTYDAIRFCPDDWLDALAVNLHDEEARDRVERLQWQMGRQLLDLGVSVIVEWGTWGGPGGTGCVWRLIPRGGDGTALRICCAGGAFERIQRRGREDPPITWEAVLRWEAIFEAPTAEEMALFDAPSA